MATILRVSLVVPPCHDDVIPAEGRESRAAGNVVAGVRQTERRKRENMVARL